jgi:DNA polymerase III subunit epsilon
MPSKKRRALHARCHFEDREWTWHIVTSQSAVDTTARIRAGKMIKSINGSFVEWCNEVIQSRNFVILDTETTGFSNAEVIDLGIIDTKGNILYDGLLRPKCPIEESAQAVHHITEEMVASAPTFKEEWHAIQRRIKGKSIIAYNAAFDQQMLVNSALIHHVRPPVMNWYCLMKEYQRHMNFQKWQKLSVACEQQGIAFSQQHRALGDTMAALELIRAVARKARSSDMLPIIENWDDIEKALNR